MQIHDVLCLENYKAVIKKVDIDEIISVTANHPDSIMELSTGFCPFVYKYIMRDGSVILTHHKLVTWLS